MPRASDNQTAQKHLQFAVWELAESTGAESAPIGGGNAQIV